MGLFDVLLGRTKPVKADLDRLFALPGAAITLDVSGNLLPQGVGAVCFKPSSGAAFENTSSEFMTVLSNMEKNGATHRSEMDNFGYQWIIVSDSELESLTNSIHLINRTLEDHGFAPTLLCSAFRFADRVTSQPVYWMYLYKKGTFYPFVPTGPEQRDNERELSLKAIVASDLPIEPDLSSWMAPWGLPL